MCAEYGKRSDVHSRYDVLLLRRKLFEMEEDVYRIWAPKRIMAYLMLDGEEGTSDITQLLLEAEGPIEAMYTAANVLTMWMAVDGDTDDVYKNEILMSYLYRNGW